MDIKQQDEIINYMIRKNPESTIKDFMREMSITKPIAQSLKNFPVSFKSVITYAKSIDKGFTGEK